MKIYFFLVYLNKWTYFFHFFNVCNKVYCVRFFRFFRFSFIALIVRQCNGISNFSHCFWIWWSLVYLNPHTKCNFDDYILKLKTKDKPISLSADIRMNSIPFYTQFSFTVFIFFSPHFRHQNNTSKCIRVCESKSGIFSLIFFFNENKFLFLKWN